MISDFDQKSKYWYMHVQKICLFIQIQAFRVRLEYCTEESIETVTLCIHVSSSLAIVYSVRILDNGGSKLLFF